MIFPWIKDEIKKISSKFNPTTIGFLTLLKNLRWSIIQDYAVLIEIYNREHVLFRDIKTYISIKSIIDYSYKMKVFLKDDMKFNIHLSMISSILPDIKSYIKKIPWLYLKQIIPSKR